MKMGEGAPSVGIALAKNIVREVENFLNRLRQQLLDTLVPVDDGVKSIADLVDYVDFYTHDHSLRGKVVDVLSSVTATRCAVFDLEDLCKNFEEKVNEYKKMLRCDENEQDE